MCKIPLTSLPTLISVSEFKLLFACIFLHWVIFFGWFHLFRDEHEKPQPQICCYCTAAARCTAVVGEFMQPLLQHSPLPVPRITYCIQAPLMSQWLKQQLLVEQLHVGHKRHSHTFTHREEREGGEWGREREREAGRERGGKCNETLLHLVYVWRRIELSNGMNMTHWWAYSTTQTMLYKHEMMYCNWTLFI